MIYILYKDKKFILFCKGIKLIFYYFWRLEDFFYFEKKKLIEV